MERTKPPEAQIEEAETLGDQIAALLAQIVELYQDDIRITLVTRSMNSPDGSRDTMITNDSDHAALIDCFRRLWRKRESPEVKEAVKLELNG